MRKVIFSLIVMSCLVSNVFAEPFAQVTNEACWGLADRPFSPNNCDPSSEVVFLPSPTIAKDSASVISTGYDNTATASSTGSIEAVSRTFHVQTISDITVPNYKNYTSLAAFASVRLEVDDTLYFSGPFGASYIIKWGGVSLDGEFLHAGKTRYANELSYSTRYLWNKKDDGTYSGISRYSVGLHEGDLDFPYGGINSTSGSRFMKVPTGTFVDFRFLVSAYSVVVGGDGSSRVDYLHTLGWSGIESVTNLDGTPATDWGLTSESGINWALPAVSSVPEPSQITLLIVGGAALLIALRRRYTSKYPYKLLTISISMKN